MTSGCVADVVTDSGEQGSGGSLAAFVSAAPDMALALTFLTTWISPAAWRERMVSYLMLVMLLEFVIVHSSGFMGMVMVGDLPRSKKTLALLGLGAFYSLFVGGFSAAFRTWWPLLAFWGLTANRLLGVLIGQVPTGEEKQLVMNGWAVSGAFYLLFVFATTLLPVPELGITPQVIRTQELAGGGLWVDQPYRVLAFGFLYFGAVSISEMYGHAWVFTLRPPGSDRRVSC